MPSMIEAWFSASDMTASSGPRSGSNSPPFASKQGEEDRVVHPEEAGQGRLELPVEVLRPADEADRGHAIAVLVDGALGGLGEARVVGQAEIVVGAEVQDAPPAHVDVCGLRRGDRTLALHQPGGVDLREGPADMGQEIGHRAASLGAP
jgi:hypothetical protein